MNRMLITDSLASRHKCQQTSEQRRNLVCGYTIVKIVKLSGVREEKDKAGNNINENSCEIKSNCGEPCSSHVAVAAALHDVLVMGEASGGRAAAAPRALTLAPSCPH